MQATIVFEKIWQAINAKNADGSRKYKYIINTGSSRSSKTYSILQAHYLFASENQNMRISIWRETKQDTKNTVLADFKKAIVNFPNHETVVFNKTESIYTFTNKSTIEICGGDDENRVHGFQGDVAHFNEPYKISKETFDQIDMRTSGFILIDWNPKAGHWIDTLSKLENAIVIHSTFKDNPFCPTEQRLKILSYQPLEFSDVVLKGLIQQNEARQYDVEKNPLNFSRKQINELTRCILNDSYGTSNRFNWQVYGLGEKSEKPNRIFSWKEISDSAYNEINTPIYIGNDWGKVDPWAIVECKYQDGALYLKELNYYSENEIRQNLKGQERLLLSKDGFEEDSMDEGLVSWYFERLGISKKSTIVCDSNRPRKIAALRRLGYENAMPASKPKGSIIDGIDLMENLKIYYTSSSKNIAYEQENYSRKVDRYGTILEEPEDKDNHCFIGSTLVQTINGPIPIKDIQVGEMVLTSNGYKKVLHKFNNGKKQVYKYSMQFDTKTVYLCSTETHNIKTEKAWVQIQNLKAGNVLFLHKNLTEKLTTYIKMKGILVKALNGFTALFGNFTTDQYQKDMTFTTSTQIQPTIESKTLTWSLNRYICGILEKRGLKKILNGLKNFMQKELKAQKNGIDLKMAESGIQNIQKKDGLIGITTQRFVNNAEKNIKLDIQENQDFATTTVNQNTEEIKDLITLKKRVKNAEDHTSQISTQKLQSVKVVDSWTEDVYDLMVEDTHEYFANGILVHNCIDSVRYVALYLQKKGIIKLS